ncbi:DUF192 domain-containing protein [Verticiella sediminum]|uniref:DUF192 domain-containing protein n=1 Tax=Verticiella sediminum TaxID=1247510 RepID=UPI001FE5B871|nr:DUF192 domain-containing protein [Verticiella sediminum]
MQADRRQRGEPATPDAWSKAALRVSCQPARGWRRWRGLIGRPAPPPGVALRFAFCMAVHTVGMAYAIDVVFVGWDGRVCRVVAGMPAGRLAMCWRARDVLELAAGEAARLGLCAGVAVQAV